MPQVGNEEEKKENENNQNNQNNQPQPAPAQNAENQVDAAPFTIKTGLDVDIKNFLSKNTVKEDGVDKEVIEVNEYNSSNKVMLERTQKFISDHIDDKDLDNVEAYYKAIAENPEEANGLTYLNYKIATLEAIKARKKAIEEDTKLSKAPMKTTQVNENGVEGKVINITQKAPQTTTNGCSAVAMSNMIQGALGGHIDQQMIRANSGSSANRDFSDRYQGVEDYSNVLTSVVPNTGMTTRLLADTKTVGQMSRYTTLLNKKYTSLEISDDADGKYKAFKEQFKETIDKQFNENRENSVKADLDKVEADTLKEFKGVLELPDDQDIKTLIANKETRGAKGDFCESIINIMNAKEDKTDDDLKHTVEENYKNCIKGNNEAPLEQADNDKVSKIVEAIKKHKEESKKIKPAELSDDQIIKAKDDIAKKLLETEENVNEFAKKYNKEQADKYIKSYVEKHLSDNEKNQLNRDEIVKKKVENEIAGIDKSKQKLISDLQKTIESNFDSENPSVMPLTNSNHYLSVVGYGEKDGKKGFFYIDPLKYDKEGYEIKDPGKRQFITYEDYINNNLIKKYDVDQISDFSFSCSWVNHYSLDEKGACKVDGFEGVEYTKDENTTNSSIKFKENEIGNKYTHSTNSLGIHTFVKTANGEDSIGVQDDIILPATLRKGEPYKSREDYRKEHGYKEVAKPAKEVLLQSEAFSKFVNDLDKEIVNNDFLHDVQFTEADLTNNNMQTEDATKVLLQNDSQAGKDFMAKLDKVSAGPAIKNAIIRVNRLKNAIDKYKAGLDKVAHGDAVEEDYFGKVKENISKELSAVDEALNGFEVVTSDKSSVFFNNFKQFSNSVKNMLAEEKQADADIDLYQKAYVIKEKTKFLDGDRERLEKLEVKIEENKTAIAENKKLADSLFDEISKKDKEILGSDIGQNYSKAATAKDNAKKALADYLKEKGIDLNNAFENFPVNIENQEKFQQLESKEDYTKLKKTFEEKNKTYKERFEEYNAKRETELGSMQKTYTEMLGRIAEKESLVRTLESEKGVLDTQIKLESEEITENKLITDSITSAKTSYKEPVRAEAECLLSLVQGMERTARWKWVNSDEYNNMNEKAWEIQTMLMPKFRDPGNISGDKTIDPTLFENREKRENLKNALTEMKDMCQKYIEHSTVDKNGNYKVPYTDRGQNRLYLASKYLEHCDKMMDKINTYEKKNKIFARDVKDKAVEVSDKVKAAVEVSNKVKEAVVNVEKTAEARDKFADYKDIKKVNTEKKNQSHVTDIEVEGKEGGKTRLNLSGSHLTLSNDANKGIKGASTAKKTAKNPQQERKVPQGGMMMQ